MNKFLDFDYILYPETYSKCFKGGKTSSASTQQTSQTTTSSDASGIVGDVYQGQSITINDRIPDEVASLFSGLVDLTGKAIDSAIASGETAINSVSDVKTTQISPDTAQTKILSPTLIILAIGFTVFAFMIGRK
jgi:hypothetical protein